MVSDEKVYSAVSKFLDSRGLEVIDTAWEFAPYGYKGIVAKDTDGEIVFVTIAVEDEELPEGSELKQNRGAVESAAARWAVNSDYDFCGLFRFDEIALLILNDNRAMLRHHINCLS